MPVSGRCIHVFVAWCAPLVVAAVPLAQANGEHAASAGDRCEPAPVPGSFIEIEPNCGVPVDNYNGGCRSPVNAAVLLPRNAEIKGTLTDDIVSSFDTDTYEIELPAGGGNISVSVIAPFQIYAAIDDLSCSTPLTSLVLANACQSGTVTRLTLPAGRHRVMITSSPAQLPCGSTYTAVISSCTCIGDMNGDCTVGTADLVQMLNRFGIGNILAYAPGDLNGDRAVNTADLSLLLLRFGCSGS